MEIRRADERDLGGVGELLLQVARLHHEGRPDIFREGRRKYSDNDLLLLFANRDTPVYVACEDGRVLGYAFCILKETKGSELLSDRRTFYIDDLCVNEAMRGRGIGSALYAHVRGEAARLACDSVTLNVWCFNRAAMAFYEKCGMSALKTVMEDILP